MREQEHTLRLCKFYIGRYRCSTCVCMISDSYTHTHIRWINTPRTQNGFLNQTAATTVECFVSHVRFGALWCGQRARAPGPITMASAWNLKIVSTSSCMLIDHVSMLRNRNGDGHQLQWTITIVQSRIVVLNITAIVQIIFDLFATFFYNNFCAVPSFTATSNSVLSEQ